MENGAVDNIGDGLCRKDNGGICLTENLEPFADLRCKLFVVKEDPALIQNDDGRLPFQALLDPMENIHERCSHNLRRAHEFLHFERLPGAELEAVYIRIENTSIGTAGAERRQGFFQFFGLDRIHEVCHAAQTLVLTNV